MRTIDAFFLVLQSGFVVFLASNIPKMVVSTI
jgi:hypothetical protein